MTELGYIGDGVYLSFDGYQYWLAVGDHNNKVVALEPSVWFELKRRIANHQADSMRNTAT